MVFLLFCDCNVMLCIFVVSGVHAEDAVLARLSHTAYMRAMEARLKAASKLSVRQIVKVAVICSFIVSAFELFVSSRLFLVLSFVIYLLVKMWNSINIDVFCLM
jgi:hypothetical protein